MKKTTKRLYIYIFKVFFGNGKKINFENNVKQLQIHLRNIFWRKLMERGRRK